MGKHVLQRMSNVRLDDGAYVVHGHRLVHRQQGIRVEAAQGQVGVGDGGTGAAPSITDGSRNGTGAFLAMTYGRSAMSNSALGRTPA